MSSAEWNIAPLGAVAQLLSGGTPSKREPSYWGGTIPWITAKDMKSVRLHDSEDHLTREGALKAASLVPAGAILVLVRGMTLHNDVPIGIAMRELAFNQDVKAVLPGDGIDGRFLAYALLASRARLLGLVDSASHGTGRIRTDALEALAIPLPPRDEQFAISELLSALDDKIELNRRMNETLEAIVDVTFASWFVIDEKQRELEEAELGELITLSRDVINPQAFPDEIFDHFSIPAFDDGRIPKAEAGSTIKSAKLLVPPASVLLSKLNPRIPRVWLPSVRERPRAIASGEFLVAVPREPMSREYVYALLRSRWFFDRFSGRVTGTSGSHQRVKTGDALAMPVVVPRPPHLAAFTEVAQPLLARVGHNLRESQTLAALRDALLPKLISGEIRVREAGTVVEEVA